MPVNEIIAKNVQTRRNDPCLVSIVRDKFEECEIKVWDAPLSLTFLKIAFCDYLSNGRP